MASKTVCVTGATGYIATHCVRLLLERGYTVRGTLRSRSSPKTECLRRLPGAEQRLSLHEANLLEPGSYDSVIEGCDYVLHVASPFHVHPTSADDFMRPAVEGTRNVYEACAKSSTVKRVVTTSSFAAVMLGRQDNPNLDHARVYTEDDWNEISPVKKDDKSHWYRASKVAAEKLGWQFVNERSPQWDLITINPPLVIGDWLPGYDTLNTSSEIISWYLTGQREEAPAEGMAFVHVRDVAEAHVRAMETPGASGRYLICGGSTSWMDVCNMLRDIRPDLADRIPSKQAAGGPFHLPQLDVTKAQRDLGLEFRSVRQCLVDQVDTLDTAGLLRTSKE